MRLRTLCLGMRTRRFLRRFQSPFVRSFAGCCLSWWIFFRRLRVLILLLLLLGLCSRISLAPLFLLLLLSTSRGSRGSARLWLMRMLALLPFFLLGVLTFPFYLHVTLPMLSGVTSLRDRQFWSILRCCRCLRSSLNRRIMLV